MDIRLNKIYHYEMTQEHPDVAGSGPLAPAPSAVFPPAPIALELVFVWVPFLPPRSIFSGLTATLTGVGWVLNTGTSAASNVFVSGDSMPFPIHISLILSPPEHPGMPLLVEQKLEN
jgi:hypothetical protein